MRWTANNGMQRTALRAAADAERYLLRAGSNVILLYARKGESIMKSNLKTIGGRILSILFVIFLTACGSGGGDDGNNGSQPQVATLDSSYFPLTNGVTMVYIDNNGDQWTIKMSDENNAFKMELSKNGEVYENVWVTSGTDGLKESKEQIWVDPNNYLNSTQGGNPKGAGYVEEWHLWSPSFIVFPYGLKVGESRTITKNEEIYIPDGNDGVVGGCATESWTDWNYIEQESTVTVEKEETITVPAGTFDTLKVKP